MKESSMEKATFCSVKLIVNSYEKFCKYSTSERLRSSISVRLKNVLQNSLVNDGDFLDLSSSRLAKLYGMTKVFVKKCQTQSNCSKGIVSSVTVFHIESVHSEDFHSLKQKFNTTQKLAGLESETEKLCKMLNFNRFSGKVTLHRPIGVILHGPSGCGKTSLGHVVSEYCDAIVLDASVDELQHSDPGAGPIAVQRLFNKALSLLQESPVVIFIDDIDSLCPRPERASVGSQQLTHALINEMDNLQKQGRGGIMVMSTTNSIANLNPILRNPGRFDQEVLISVPSYKQRVAILKLLTSHTMLAEDVCQETLARQTPGFVGADLKLLCDEALDHAYSNCSEIYLPRISSSDFEFALHAVSPSLKKGSDCVVELKPVSWDSIGGLGDVKAELKQAIEWPLKYPQVLQRMDLLQTKGILLYGPPGCCKTTLVKAFATTCHVNFLCLNGAQAFSAYVGESEKIVSEAFRTARALAPSILFIDEIESLVGKRTSDKSHSRVQERILATMLNEMDGVGSRLDNKMDATESSVDSCDTSQRVLPSGDQGTETNRVDVQTTTNGSSHDPKVIVVGATNRKDMLDSAILRPGRLDKHIYIPPPDVMARKEILKIFTAKMTSDMDFDSLAQKTDCYTGADLKNLCKEAGLLALREQLQDATTHNSSMVVTDSHFCRAQEAVKPSLSQELIKQYLN